MKTLICILAIFLLLFYQNSSASRVAFQASTSNISPVITKSLTLRCAVKQDTKTNSAERTVISKRALQSIWTTNRISEHSQTPPLPHLQNNEPLSTTSKVTTRTTTTAHPTSKVTEKYADTVAIYATTANVTHLNVISNTTHSTATGSTHPDVTTTTYPYPSSSLPPTTASPPDTTTGNVSHIVSIIISKHDNFTGRLQTVALLSVYDPPTASIDFENIKVEGSLEPPNALEQGYLQVSWEYPGVAQSGIYVCDIFAVDSTVHPIALSSSVRITDSEPTFAQLAGLVALNTKEVNELKQSLSEAKSQLSTLKQENQNKFEVINNTTNTLLDKANNISAQNIQTGNIPCYSTTTITFPKPYTRIPTVFISVVDFHTQSSSNGMFTLTIQNVDITGFTLYCQLNAYVTINTVMWIAIDN